MTKRIFASILIATLLSILLCFSLITVLLHKSHDQELWDELENQGHLAAAGTERSGLSYLTGLEIDNRITWIASDGTVLYDSKIDNLSSMNNHLERVEVIDALKKGYGKSERFSDSISEINCYYAIRLSDNTILRISATQHTLFSVLLDMLLPFTLIIIAVTILSVILAIMLSRRIVRPINNLTLENLQIETEYPEISGLLHKIKRQNILIGEQMRDLRRRSEEFHTITENMQEGLLVLDALGDLLICNQAALHILSNKHGSPKIGNSFLSLNLPDSLQKSIQLALKGTHNEQRLHINESVYSLFANPVLASDGHPEGAVIFIMDITETQNREEMRREFTSNVSHELKTPLTSIYGISEMLKTGMVRSEDIPKFASDIHEETGRLITLVNDIIRLSQLDENRIGTETEAVNLYHLASETLSRLHSAMDIHDIHAVLQGENISVMGVRSILSEIIYNLVDNAIKYNKVGGSITISIESEEGHPVLRVSDTGIGIPQSDLNRVFERFYRVDKSHSREIGGTGLGLSIVKHGCVYLGASISIASTLGIGTTVSIRFADSI